MNIPNLDKDLSNWNGEFFALLAGDWDALNKEVVTICKSHKQLFEEYKRDREAIATKKHINPNGEAVNDIDNLIKDTTSIEELLKQIKKNPVLPAKSLRGSEVVHAWLDKVKDRAEFLTVIDVKEYYNKYGNAPRCEGDVRLSMVDKLAAAYKAYTGRDTLKRVKGDRKSAFRYLVILCFDAIDKPLNDSALSRVITIQNKK